MKLTVLVDNNTLIDQYYTGEAGLSFYIEDEETTILFDTGYSDVFIRNSVKLNINLQHIHFLVLSHGHNDHTWGLDHLVRLIQEYQIQHPEFIKPKLIAHPQVFYSKSNDDKCEIGSLLSENQLFKYYDLQLDHNPVWITKNIVFLGEIPRINTFENKIPCGFVYDGNHTVPDFLKDDSALVYKGKKGLVIITGCSHAGICNIVEYAKKVCQEDKIESIIGGMHLLETSESVMTKTIGFLKIQNLSEIRPCHCVDLSAKIALSQVAPIKEIGSGLKINFD